MALINEHTQGSNVRRNYKKYTDEDRMPVEMVLQLHFENLNLISLD